MTLLLAVVAFLPLCGAGIVPFPKHQQISGDPVSLSNTFRVFTTSGSPRLHRGLARYHALFAALPQLESENSIFALTLQISGTSDRLSIETDYSYNISVNNGRAFASANSIYGGLYAVESFLQLAHQGVLPGSSIEIQDAPDFAWRGLMVDTGRRFFPMPLLQNLMDTMAAAKLNVLHLHASDMCRFGVESKRYPNLTDALVGIHAGHYTQDDIRNMTAYAADRGIRVVPEFDVPGHSRGFLPLQSQGVHFCRDTANKNQLYNDPNNETYNVVADVMDEMISLFPDDVFNIGCDETSVVDDCSLSSTFAFERQLLNRIQDVHNKTPAGWEEVLFDANAATTRTVVSAWSRHTPGQITAKGNHAINAQESHFYFTRPAAGGASGWAPCWTDINSDVPASQRSLLLGGSMSMWSDMYCYIDQCGSSTGATPPGAILFNPKHDLEFSQSIGGMIWPRGLVAAAAFWHYNSSIDSSSTEFVDSINQLNDQLQSRGSYVCPTGCSCDYLTYCGKPYLNASVPSNGATISMQPCDDSLSTSQQFIYDSETSFMRLAANSSLCVKMNGNEVYPLVLDNCGDVSTKWNHDGSLFKTAVNENCMDIMKDDGSVGTWVCGTSQSNQMFVYDGSSHLIVGGRHAGSTSGYEGDCLTATAN